MAQKTKFKITCTSCKRGDSIRIAPAFSERVESRWYALICTRCDIVVFNDDENATNLPA